MTSVEATATGDGYAVNVNAQTREAAINFTFKGAVSKDPPWWGKKLILMVLNLRTCDFKIRI